MRNVIVVLSMLLVVSFATSQSSDVIELEYNTVRRTDMSTGNIDIKRINTNYILKDNDLTIYSNEVILEYKVLVNTVKNGINGEGTPYFSYNIINITNGRMYKLYHVLEDVIIEEDNYIFRFFNQ